MATASSSHIPAEVPKPPSHSLGGASSSSARVRNATPPPRVRVAADARVKSAVPPQLQEPAALRAGFVRKVYGIVTAQLVMTAAVAHACVLIAPLCKALLSIGLTGWFRLAVLAPTLACLFGLQWMGRSYPWNYYLLFGFTLSISFNLGFVCAMMSEVGLAHLPLLAAAITAVLFGGLSAFTLRSRRDFSSLRSFLSVALSVLLLASFVGWWLSLAFVDVVVSWCGALTFCGYIVYDTHALSKKLDYDDYITGAAELYLDIVNLFIYVLRILLDKNKEDKKEKKRD